MWRYSWHTQQYEQYIPVYDTCVGADSSGFGAIQRGSAHSNSVFVITVHLSSHSTIYGPANSSGNIRRCTISHLSPFFYQFFEITLGTYLAIMLFARLFLYWYTIAC